MKNENWTTLAKCLLKEIDVTVFNDMQTAVLAQCLKNHFHKIQHDNFILKQELESSKFLNNLKTINRLEIIKNVEQKLNPEYLNSVFTWAQIENAIKEI